MNHYFVLLVITFLSPFASSVPSRPQVHYDHYQPPLDTSPSYHNPIGHYHSEPEEFHESSHEHHEHHSEYQSHVKHGPEGIPAKSDVYHHQDVSGNYGFGYETINAKGEGDFRHEKRTGSKTEGSYGFRTNSGNVQAHYSHNPVDKGHHHPSPSGLSPVPDHPPYHPAPHQPPPNHSPPNHLPPYHSPPNHLPPYHSPPNHLPPYQPQSTHLPPYHPAATPPDLYNAPPISDIPPAASAHDDIGHSLGGFGTMFLGPRYASEYDVDIPQFFYSRLLSDILNTDDSIHEIILPPEPDEPQASSFHSDPIIMSEAINNIYNNPHLSQYLSYLDRIVPSGMSSRLSLPVYRDRRRKK